MNYANIENEKVVNVIVADEEFANEIGAIYCGTFPISVGDEFINNQFVQKIVDYDDEGNEIGEHFRYIDVPSPLEETTSAELREQVYETMLYKQDGTDLIIWDGTAITVDQANKKWLDYSAEGSDKANTLSALIVEAKNYIREKYPDA